MFELRWLNSYGEKILQSRHQVPSIGDVSKTTRLMDLAPIEDLGEPPSTANWPWSEWANVPTVWGP